MKVENIRRQRLNRIYSYMGIGKKVLKEIFILLKYLTCFLMGNEIFGNFEFTPFRICLSWNCSTGSQCCYINKQNRSPWPLHKGSRPNCNMSHHRITRSLFNSMPILEVVKPRRSSPTLTYLHNIASFFWFSHHEIV